MKERESVEKEAKEELGVRMLRVRVEEDNHQARASNLVDMRVQTDWSMEYEGTYPRALSTAAEVAVEVRWRRGGTDRRRC
ncbi:hypothetical protein M0804_014877 [Polistes exclamans]|nr:hypothetical protein M0804_014879 [Polistes exclamans]KAI4474401.1 hypothetical protein M0804_014877 [Polistes exclamans]